MLKFASLSRAQKRFVVSMIESNPSLRSNPNVTLKDCSSHYHNMIKVRATTGIKIGFPNWLFKENKVQRGVYKLPVPNDIELSQYVKDLTQNSTHKVANPKKPNVTKIAKSSTKKVVAAPIDEDEDNISGSRLEKIISESEYLDDDIEDFNEILRQNGIEV